MKSNKWVLGLLTVALVLALAPSGFAQTNVTAVQLSILNAPSAAEIAGNRHAQVSDPVSVGAGIQISGSVFATNTGITTVNLVLTFPNAITSSMQGAVAGGGGAVPNANDNIRIVGATGIFASLTSVTSINYSAGTITIQLPSVVSVSSSGPTSSGSFTLAGVRIDLTGAVTGTSRNLLSAVLQATTGGTLANGNGFVAPSSMPVLISTIQPGAATGAVGSTGTNNGVITIFTNQTAGTFADGTASVLFTEPFVTAWRTPTQSATNGTVVASGTAVSNNNGTQLSVSISGLPAGLSASFTQQTGTQATISPTSFALSSTTTTQIVSFTTTDMTATDKVGFDITITGTPTSGSLSAASLQVTAALAPIVGIGGALGGLTTTGATAPNTSGGIPSNTGGFPRFDATGNTTTVTVGSILPLQTTMLIPYALRQSPFESTYSIANTSLDPFTTGSATSTAGTVQFWLFPNSATGIGTMTTVTTNATNATTTGQFLNRGLNASGQVVAGGTFTFTHSMLMSAAGLTGDFIGYIFVQANFPNAHGVSYVFTSGNLTSSTPMEVMATPSITSRANTTGAVETLGF